MIVEKIFSEQDSDEKLYSVLMDEDEIALFSDFLERLYSKDKKSKKDEKDEEDKEDDVDDYEGLNWRDSQANKFDKNPFTIKKVRKAERDYLSKENGKGRALSNAVAMGAAIPAGLGGALIGSSHGTAGAIGGAMAAGLGTHIGVYGASRLGRRLRNKIRKSGGGGTYDDMFARKADRLAMLDGEMSKEDFKKKWYRYKDAR